MRLFVCVIIAVVIGFATTSFAQRNQNCGLNQNQAAIPGSYTFQVLVGALINDGNAYTEHWKNRKADYEYNLASQAAPNGLTNTQAAANTWTNASWNNQGGPGAFRFNYVGTTNRFANKKDNHNVIAFQPIANVGGRIVTGRTYILKRDFFRPDRLKEVDMALNSNAYWFSDWSNWQLGEYDIQSIVLHEFGHWLLLDELDQNDNCTEFNNAVMDTPIAPDTMRRQLSWIDRWGKWYIYSSGQVSMAPSAVAVTDSLNVSSDSAAELLPSFPAPANPEVWLPYCLFRRTSVRIHIYDGRGALVRMLDVGVQPRGNYVTKERAAYWNGHNQSGERVATGVYFYTLETRNEAHSGKIVIGK
jgi:hypothetical protein